MAEMTPDLTTLFETFLNESTVRTFINSAADHANTNAEQVQVGDLSDGIQNARNEVEVIQNLEAIFNMNCDMETVVTYMLKKCRHIETQFESYADLHEIITSPTNTLFNKDDKETFLQLKYGLIQCYVVGLNVIEDRYANNWQKEKKFGVRLTHLYSSEHVDYDENGAYASPLVNGRLLLNTYPSLLAAITIFFILYEAFLRVSYERSLDVQQLRSILYAVKVMSGASEHKFSADRFYLRVQDIYEFLHMTDKSIFISYVNRQIKLSIAGDCLMRKESGDSVSFMCARGTLMTINGFNYALDHFQFGSSVKAILIIESNASFTPLSRSSEFLDKIHVEKTLVVITGHGQPTFDVCLCLQAITSSSPNIPAFALFDGDLPGHEMCDRIRMGKLGRDPALNRACCVGRLVRIGINPFSLATTSPIPMIRMSAQDEANFADKLSKFKRNGINFEYHRNFYECIALQLIIGFLASSNDTPVQSLISLIDRLLAEFGERLCLNLGDGLIYFQCANELAYFWSNQYEWERVDFCHIDAIIKHKIIPPIFIDRFISLLNTMVSATSNVKMNSMVFNSILNSFYVCPDEFDIQIIQIDISSYICVYLSEQTVDVCGLQTKDFYAKIGMKDLLKKRYPGNTVSEYVEMSTDDCPAYLSGVFFCHFAICVAMNCSPALNQPVNEIELLSWFKKIVTKQNPLGPYVPT